MPGFIFHVQASAICTHSAPIQTISSNTRVLVSGLPAATMADQYLVTGCPFVIPGTTKYSPCLTVRWLVPAARVFVNGQPVLVQSSTGLCLNDLQAPQGPPTIITTQTRVAAL